MTVEDKRNYIKSYCGYHWCSGCPLSGRGVCYSTDDEDIINQNYRILTGGNEMSETKKDAINPSHYKQGGIECIEALKAATINLKGIDAVCTANAIKYLWRWKEKNGLEDLNKAIWYINRLIKENTHE